MSEVMDPIAALRGKTWEELEVIEHEGRVLFPDAIRRRTAKGAVEEVPIMVRVLRKPERRKAFLDAVKWAQELGILPKDMPDFSNVKQRAIDPELFDDMDTLCILARAIREAKDPHEQHMLPSVLEQTYDGGSLAELYSRYKVYEDRVDPRLEITNEKELWGAIRHLAKAGHLLPLTELASSSQNACILFMASQALRSPKFKSFLESTGSSTAVS